MGSNMRGMKSAGCVNWRSPGWPILCGLVHAKGGAFDVAFEFGVIPLV